MNTIGLAYDIEFKSQQENEILMHNTHLIVIDMCFQFTSSQYPDWIRLRVIEFIGETRARIAPMQFERYRRPTADGLENIQSDKQEEI